MEGLTLEQTINEISQAWAELQNAKSDYNDRACAALDSFEQTNPDLTKTDRKNIIKLAKAMAAGKKKDVEAESESLAGLVEQLA